MRIPSLLRVVSGIIALVTGWVIIQTPVMLAFLFFYPEHILPFLAFNVWISFLIMYAQLVAHWYTSSSVKLKKLLASTRLSTLPQDSVLARFITRIAHENGVSLSGVWVYQSNTPNAIAIGCKKGGLVAFSSALLEFAEPEELAWVTAHEIAHLKHGDSCASAYLISAQRALTWGYQIRSLILRIAARMTLILPVPSAVIYAFWYPVIGLLTFTGLAEKASRSIIFLADKFINRQMEYAADRLATEQFGASPGITLLQKLPSGLEPGLGLFSTHPGTGRRIKHILATERLRGRS